MKIIVSFCSLVLCVQLADAAPPSPLPPRAVPLLRQNPYYNVIQQCMQCNRTSDESGLRRIANAFLPNIEKAADEQNESMNDFSLADHPTPEMDVAALFYWYLGNSYYRQGDMVTARKFLEKTWRKYPLARFRHPEKFVWMPARDAYLEWLVIGYVEAIKDRKLDKYPFDPTQSVFHAAGAQGVLNITPMTEAARFVFFTEGANCVENAMNQMLASAEINNLENSHLIEDMVDAFTKPVDSDSEEGWTKLRNHLEAWGRACPESSLQKLALVGFWMQYAWHARGGGYAGTVTDDGWKLFEERLNRALDLQRQWVVEHPMWFVHSLILGRGLSAETSVQTAIFEEGIAKFPNFLPIYQQMQVYLLPRWHGAPGEWELFAIWAARKAGPELYLELCLNAEGFEGREAVEQDPLIDWKFLREGFESKMKAGRLSWVTANKYASRACARNDKAAALAAFGNPATRFHPLFWNGLADFKQWRDWARQ